MKFRPTVELTPETTRRLATGQLTLQPGQWVKGAKGRGRYLRTNPRTGVNYVSWVRKGDDWQSQAERFHRACIKGFVGKYRALYDTGTTDEKAADGKAARP